MTLVIVVLGVGIVFFGLIRRSWKSHRVGVVAPLTMGKMPKAPNQDILLDTSAGNAIWNTQAPAILMPAAAQALVDEIAYPSRLRSMPHPRYNCHGLTFGSRRAAIDDAAITMILAEDGYQPVANRADVLPGDVALYISDAGIEHSAIVASVPEGPLFDPFVYSKWGVLGPEVYHLVSACEYAKNDIRYYRVIP